MRENRPAQIEDMELPEMIHAILTHPAFDKAWEECKGFGIGLKENYDLVYQRFYKYDFVRDRITETSKEILKASEALLGDDITDGQIEEFFHSTLKQLIAVAIAHFITGMMVGATWYIKATDSDQE